MTYGQLRYLHDKAIKRLGELLYREWLYVLQTNATLADGAYRAQIVTDSVSPLYFVFN